MYEHQRNSAFLGVFAVLALAGLAFYWLEQFEASRPSPHEANQGAAATTTAPTTSAQTGILARHEDLDEVTSGWKEYSNAFLGFSIKVPPRVSIGGGASSTVDAFEDVRNSRVYLASAVYPGKDGELRRNSVEILNVGGRAGLYPNTHVWQIEVRSVAGPDELNRFIEERFGPGCVMEQMDLQRSGEAYDIEVSSDGSADSPCKVPYRYVIKYDPKKGKAAAWDLGQSPRFTDGEQELDSYMAATFRFH